jgi:hypothetical protein
MAAQREIRGAHAVQRTGVKGNPRLRPQAMPGHGPDSWYMIIGVDAYRTNP